MSRSQVGGPRVRTGSALLQGLALLVALSVGGLLIWSAQVGAQRGEQPGTPNSDVPVQSQESPPTVGVEAEGSLPSATDLQPVTKTEPTFLPSSKNRFSGGSIWPDLNRENIQIEPSPGATPFISSSKNLSIGADPFAGGTGSSGDDTGTYFFSSSKRIVIPGELQVPGSVFSDDNRVSLPVDPDVEALEEVVDTQEADETFLFSSKSAPIRIQPKSPPASAQEEAPKSKSVSEESPEPGSSSDSK